MPERKEQCDIGIIGLGVMGNNLLLNMADHGFKVAGYDKEQEKIEALDKIALEDTIFLEREMKAFIGLLKRPRAVLLLVPAGMIVDSVIKELLPLLEAGDLIIDAGNSYFKTTDRRNSFLKTYGVQFLGVGISGGEAGARYGPSMMVGGSKEAYDHRIRLVFEAIAAKVRGEACVAYLGPGSCGHYVKMIHNGIEYGVMELISETYDLMKRGFGLEDDQLSEVYYEWNKGELNSYLLEITSQIFEKTDKKTDKKLIDLISDVAKQKGTGAWTTQNAVALQVPVPNIDMAVMQRNLSLFKTERLAISELYPRSISILKNNLKQHISDLRRALFASMLIVFTQGMALLKVASGRYEYGLDLELVSKIWRGGCIIRAALLEDICAAFRKDNCLAHLFLDTHFSKKLRDNQEYLRKSVSFAIQCGVPVPGFMSSLSYLDAFRSHWLPTNLIQAQRDYFGAHGYERTDMTGTFHTEWEELK